MTTRQVVLIAVTSLLLGVVLTILTLRLLQPSQEQQEASKAAMAKVTTLPGWGQTRWGMSRSEVKRVLEPTSTVKELVSTISGKDDAYSATDISIGSEPFHCELGFNDRGQLNRVSIAPKDAKSSDVYTRFRESLCEKYGAPARNRDKEALLKGSSSDKCTVEEWRLGPTILLLNHTQRKGIALPVFTAVYERDDRATL